MDSVGFSKASGNFIVGFSLQGLPKVLLAGLGETVIS